ncbi:MAG: leucyl aminopeptidase [Patescibacteria group bacterium]|nr:leucyl aminopeptidase [Patescibacteria group bacterium]MDE1965932.1 leucyl aminopeptidase [Patescibacteria group bacterium]
MKLTFASTPIEKASKVHTHVYLTEEPKGTKRFVREGGAERLEFGVGKFSEMNRRKFMTLCRSIVLAAKQQKAKKLALHFEASPALFKNLHKEGCTAEELSQLAAENFEMANYEFNAFKTKPKEGWNEVEEIRVIGPASSAIERAAKRGQEIGRAVNATRALANTPGGDMTPRTLAKAAKDAMKGLSVSVKVLGRKEMERLGMGALLGVAKGSAEEPTFTVLEYRGAAGKPIVLAGKGVTFDSGGLNLKPSQSIYEMHMDMSGAAAVIHTLALTARLGVKKHVIGLIPSVENMPGGASYRPGDVLKSLSGKTIEVLNTDAEGRLILADALTYAKRFSPAVVVDVATLTGAAMVALGLYASGLLTRDDALAKRIEEDAEASGDYVWRLPLWDEYEPMVQGTFADITNAANGASGKYGGATEGGMFLWQFAKELSAPWAHLDIAPRMTAAPGDELAKGAVGAPVRLLFRFIERWSDTDTPVAKHMASGADSGMRTRGRRVARGSSARLR